MEVNGHVSNFGLWNTLLNIFFSKFEAWPFNSIWLEISKNWLTQSQGLKKNVPVLQEGEPTPIPHTLLVII